MSEPNARERIADVAAWCLYHNEHKSMSDPAGVAAERILAIVREAMTTDTAIAAFQEAEDTYQYSEGDGWIQASRNGMRAALDKAIGKEAQVRELVGADDDGGER